MNLMNWIEMVGCLVAVGLGGLKGYRWYESKKLDKQYPEKKA